MLTFVTEISITPDMQLVNLNGKQIEVEEIITDFKVKESWSTITLNDGTIIKLKPVVIKIYRTAEKDLMTNEPIFIVTSQNVLDLTSYKGK